MLTRDLDAITFGFDYASDPTAPDIARDNVDTWAGLEVIVRLEAGYVLLINAYGVILGDIGMMLGTR